MTTSSQAHGLQHCRLPCPSPSPRVCSNLCPSSWCHPTISSSDNPFSCLQYFPASGSFPMNWLFTSGGQNIGASASVLPMNIQCWFPLGLTTLELKNVNRKISVTPHAVSNRSVSNQWMNDLPYKVESQTSQKSLCSKLGPGCLCGASCQPEKRWRCRQRRGGGSVGCYLFL